jgi:hypothetical protein
MMMTWWMMWEACMMWKAMICLEMFDYRYAIGVPKIFRKMQMRYQWIPCENSFTMEPPLRQNKILLKPKLA